MASKGQAWRLADEEMTMTFGDYAMGKVKAMEELAKLDPEAVVDTLVVARKWLAARNSLYTKPHEQSNVETMLALAIQKLYPRGTP